jgi:hypothetical protein
MPGHPNVGTRMNWLKNRRPDKWRDRVDHDMDANVTQITRVERLFTVPPKQEAP